MKKIALLTLLLINLSLSFSLPRNQASPAIFSVTKTNNSILFRHTDSTLTAIPCQSVASIVSNADPSKIVSVWVVQQGDYDKIMQFDYLVCGFSSKSDAVDSLTAWAICDTSSGGGGGVGDVSQSALDDSLTNVYTYINNNIPIITDSATITDYTVINSQNTPPVSPSTGDVYLVGTVPTDAWVGHAKDIAEWNGSAWVFTDGVQGDFLYNATNALTYIFRSGNWVQTTGVPALNNGNNISGGLKIGTNNARSLTFETNNVNRGRFDSIGRFYIYNLPISTDTFVNVVDENGKFGKVGKSSIVDTAVISTKDNVTSLLLSKANQLALNDSVTTLRNIRKVDSSYSFRNASLDSICQIVIINGNSTRSCIKDSTGGGGASLSSLTSATATNIINNGNLQQEWQWNSLANNTGFKLSSTSGGLLNTQNRLFECELTGAMPGTGSSSYAGYFKNTQAVGGATGLYAEAFTALYAKGNIQIDGGALILGINGAVFNRLSGNTYLQASPSQGLILESSNGVASIYCGSSELGLIVSRKTLNQRYVLGIGGSAYQGSYISAYTTATVIEKDLGKLIFSANTGLAGGFASFTPNNVMTINGGATEATSNVGIGTTSPVVSAKLEVSSTTSGFLPPRMTATQASAIATPAQGLMLFVTDTNGTFTSVGWWGYNGATWEKLNN